MLLEGKIFVRNVKSRKDPLFDTALDDFFEGTIKRDILPSEEDLEKMKITLNWIIRHRNKTIIYYLKDYKNRQDLGFL